MEKDEVWSFLTPYCPPLSPIQVEELSAKIADVSQKEIKALREKARKAKK